MDKNNSIVFTQTIIISEKFKEFIHSGTYEKLILNLMDKSTKLFPNEYIRIESQSNGECDFIDTKTNKKYDAKLVLTKKQGSWLGSKNSNYEKWIQAILDEIAEYNRNIKCGENIEKLSIYQIFEKAIKREPEDENLIFFMPFCIVADSSNMFYAQFARDILRSIFDRLKKNNVIGSRDIYVLYLGMEKQLVMRHMNVRYSREYFRDDELVEYIDYSVELSNDDD